MTLTYNGTEYPTRTDKDMQTAKWVLVHYKNNIPTLPDSDSLVMEDEKGFRYTRLTSATKHFGKTSKVWLFIQI